MRASQIPPPKGDEGLEIQNLSKIYRGGKRANDGLTLEVGRGEVFGLLGPNGAGKTTLVKQIIALLKPTEGSIHLHGVDLVRRPAQARRMCSYLPQGDVPVSSYRLREAAELSGRIRGGPSRQVKERVAELIAGLELEEWQNTFGAKLSGGIKRLAGFAMVCAQPVPLVILDEPTNDVDPLRRRLLWRQIRRLRDEGMTVLLVTHNVLEAEQAVDRLAIIDRGRIVAQGTPSSLKAADRGHLRLRLNLLPTATATGDGSSPKNATSLEPPPFALRSLQLDSRLHLILNEQDVPEAIHWARDLVGNGVAEEYSLGAASLEDVYLRMIGRVDALDLAM